MSQIVFIEKDKNTCNWGRPRESRKYSLCALREENFYMEKCEGSDDEWGF